MGDELYVGVHSDEAILENKGPTVMNLKERYILSTGMPPPAPPLSLSLSSLSLYPPLTLCCPRPALDPSLLATDACRWVTKSIPNAPYVTQLDWISHFGCKYVVHGDDISSDSSGEDCYRFVKAANRFKVVKRTPSISTTDLVGRMLLCTKGHFIKSLEKMLAGEEGPGTEAERKANGQAMLDRIRLYATDETARNPGAHVWFWSAERGFWELVKGVGPRPGQRVVYVDGGFDLFSSGHIQFLRLVVQAEEELARNNGWYSEQAVNERRSKGGDYGPVFVVAGVHDDNVINEWKGVNYPIMNIYERGLCVLQCRVCRDQATGFGPTAG